MLDLDYEAWKIVFKHNIDSALHNNNNNNEEALIRLVRKGLTSHEIDVYFVIGRLQSILQLQSISG
jgi:hypothetical protein